MAATAARPSLLRPVAQPAACETIRARSTSTTGVPVKPFVPWLTVLAIVIALNALKLKPLATAVALGWLGYCVWTWVRPQKR